MKDSLGLRLSLQYEKVGVIIRISLILFSSFIFSIEVLAASHSAGGFFQKDIRDLTKYKGSKGWNISGGYTFIAKHFEHEVPKIFKPYIGISVGHKVDQENLRFGLDLGVRLLHYDAYIGFNTISNSIQIGYSYFHISMGKGKYGVGVQYTFKENYYVSASSLLW